MRLPRQIVRCSARPISTSGSRACVCAHAGRARPDESRASSGIRWRAVYGPCHARVRPHRRIGNTTPIVADAPASFEAPSYIAAIEIGIAGSARSG
ncbi:hypothetical protein C6P75_00195 [Burkholderia multivorans]|nr:hypothetical protein C6P75_00195 [Burkholderia multivorans]